MSPAPRVSVLMPVYNGATFVARAIDSLLAQTLVDWELIVVDDGSTDDLEGAISPYRWDERVVNLRQDENAGLGAALNAGLSRARGSLIAYLPADDVMYADHLASLVALLDRDPKAALGYSGIRHHYNRHTPGSIDGFPLQLIQVMHRTYSESWMERGELVTDDLERMYWSRLRPHGSFISTGRITCEWVDHPGQRHKVIREPVGGYQSLSCSLRRALAIAVPFDGWQPH